MGSGAPEPALPPDFGAYRFLKVLGTGAIARVYLVEDRTLARKAVMKIADRELDSSTLERFQNEAQVLQEFHHPNIPALYNHGVLPDGRLFLLTEWIDGSTLDDLRPPGVSLSTVDALGVARALAAALQHAHERGILHLDVKPPNILVPKMGGEYAFDEAKLLDFSVRGLLKPDTLATVSGFLLGTPYYMSPEQVRAEALTPAADIFSLGSVMYEMLSGRRPFEGEGPANLLFSIIERQPEPLGPSVPPAVITLVQRCLEKDPRKRPASARELEAELARLLRTPLESGSHRIPATSPKAARPAEQHSGEFTGLFQAPASAPSPAQPVPSERPYSVLAPRRRTNPIAIGLAAAALALGAAGWWAARGLGTAPGVRSEWRFVFLGVVLVLAGIGSGIALHRYLVRRRDELAADVSALLKGAQTRRALSMTLSIQVDEVIKKCRLMDEKFLGLTLAVMVKEYGSARKFDDRQKALMNAVAILDKLEPKLSPWYIRHEKLIAAGVSLVGILSGLAAAASSVAKLAASMP